MLDGQLVDMGDVIIQTRWIVKGKRLNARMHVGVTRTSSIEDRSNTAPVVPRTGKVDHSMDLQADKKTTFSLEFTDEMDNPVPTPANVSAVYTVDDGAVIALTDNGDGTCVAASTGQLGQTVVHVNITADGLTATGDEMITVVPGDAQRVKMVHTAPEEVTPDA